MMTKYLIEKEHQKIAKGKTLTVGIGKRLLRAPFPKGQTYLCKLMGSKKIIMIMIIIMIIIIPLLRCRMPVAEVRTPLY